MGFVDAGFYLFIGRRPSERGGKKGREAGISGALKTGNEDGNTYRVHFVLLKTDNGKVVATNAVPARKTYSIVNYPLHGHQYP